MKKKIITIVFMMLFIVSTNNWCLATGLGFDPGEFQDAVGILGGSNIISNMGSAIFNAVRLAGSAIAGIYLTILSIKYMTSSVEDKAEIKRKLIPFVIGTAILFGVTFIIEIIINMANWI